jgi:hypothetical protein
MKSKRRTTTTSKRMFLQCSSRSKPNKCNKTLNLSWHRVLKRIIRSSRRTKSKKWKKTSNSSWRRISKKISRRTKSNKLSKILDSDCRRMLKRSSQRIKSKKWSKTLETDWRRILKRRSRRADQLRSDSLKLKTRMKKRKPTTSRDKEPWQFTMMMGSKKTGLARSR